MLRSTSRVGRNIFSICFLLTLVTSTKTWSQSSQADISTWSCLPEETACAIRIPNGAAFAKAFVENTKLGTVMFSEKRKQAVAKALKKNDSDKWAKFQQQLTEYGLSNDDLLQLLAGESGYAALMVDDDEGNAVPLGLAWLEPGNELAERLYEVLGKTLEAQEDEEHPVIRVDLELADREVMQLSLPSITTDHTENFERPDGFDEMSEDEQQLAWKEAYRAWQDSAVKRVRYATILVSRMGGRVLLAHSFRTAEEADAHPGAEQLAGIFARLLAEHERGEGGFMAKHANDSVVARVMGIDGVVTFEIVGDAASLMRLVPEMGNSQGEKALNMLGLKSLGPFAMRITLEGNLWQSQMSLAISRPLTGLMQWLDQPAIDLEPSAWVPASAIGYSQYSFDLGKAYAILAEQLRQEFPELSQRWLAMAEIQVSGVAQVGLEELLSSLGTRHTILNFVNKIDPSAELAAQQPDSTAIVWQVTDEQIWKRVMQTLTPMVSATDGAEFTDEQGYSGFRLQNEAIEGGLFLGNGNLVLAYGSGVLETTLSSLNNPPQGPGAFRGGEVYQRATELLEPAPNIGYSVVDGDRYAAILRKSLLSLFEQYKSAMALGGEDADDLESSWLELARTLMPSEKEINNLLGVSISRLEVNDHGILGISVQELPPPDDR